MLPSEPPRGAPLAGALAGAPPRLPRFAVLPLPGPQRDAHARRGAPSTQGSPNPALHSALWFPTDCVYSFCLCLFGTTCCSLLTTAVTTLLCKAFSNLGSFILVPFVGAGAPLECSERYNVLRKAAGVRISPQTAAHILLLSSAPVCYSSSQDCKLPRKRP